MVKFCLGAGCAGAALAAYAWRESKRVELTHTVIRLPELPAGLEGLRILHVADTHFPRNRESLPRFLDAAASLDYDIVFATGDYADTTRGWPVVAEAFRRLEPKLGIYAVIGGHERYAPAPPITEALRLLRLFRRGRKRRLVDPTPLVQQLEAAGVRVLINASTTLEIGGEAVRLIGIDDAYLGLDDLEATTKPRGTPEPAAFTILLSHSPDGVPLATTAAIPLALSGHTHGGQIRVPFYGAPVRHARAVDRRQAAGLMRIGGTQVYVSRGFGTTGLPLRFACRPELGVVELRRETE